MEQTMKKRKLFEDGIIEEHEMRYIVGILTEVLTNRFHLQVEGYDSHYCLYYAEALQDLVPNSELYCYKTPNEEKILSHYAVFYKGKLYDSSSYNPWVEHNLNKYRPKTDEDIADFDYFGYKDKHQLTIEQFEIAKERVHQIIIESDGFDLASLKDTPPTL